MAKKDDLLASKYGTQFKKHFEEVDELSLNILKSHLIIASAIDNIIRLIFFHPVLVLDARMGFFVKVQLIRAYALHEKDIRSGSLYLRLMSYGTKSPTILKVKSERRDWEPCGSSIWLRSRISPRPTRIILTI